MADGKILCSFGLLIGQLQSEKGEGKITIILTCKSVFGNVLVLLWASQVALVLKNPPGKPRELRDANSVPGTRAWQPTPVFRSENPKDRGARRVTVHGVAGSHTTGSMRAHTWFCCRFRGQ